MAELLGKYDSTLSLTQWETLLALVRSGMSEGEYAGGPLFSQDAVDALLAQAQDFSSLPVPSEGQRASADTVNYPLSLLDARFTAVAAEKDKFFKALEQYISVLTLDARQIDRMLSAAEMVFWQSRLPKLDQAQVFAYDVLSTHGPQATDIDQTDPGTGKSYTDLDGNLLPLSDVSFGQTSFVGGLGAPLSSKTIHNAMRLRWNLVRPAVPPEHIETLIDGKNTWASLALLPAESLLDYSNPVVSVILPQAQAGATVIRLRGTPLEGNLQVVIKIQFVPRQKLLTFTPTSVGQVIQLSSYNISLTDLLVFSGGNSYFNTADFKLDGSTKTLTVTNSAMVGKIITAIFTEYYPGYQCSVNNLDFSPVVLFDPAQPFPDPSRNWLPILIEDGWYPVMDELGNSLGLEFQPIAKLDTEYLLEITSSGVAGYGAEATLEIDLAEPGFLNGVHLNPFTTLPVRLKSIGVQGLDMNGTPSIMYSGNLLIDRPMSVRFANADGSDVFVSRLFLNLAQENYTLEQVIVPSTDQLRKQTRATLQTIFPVTSRPLNGSLPATVIGAQYDFALRDIAGERWTMSNPGLVVFGPFAVEAVPEVLRLDYQSAGTVSSYLMYQITDQAGVKHPAGGNIVFTNGTSVSFLDVLAAAGYAGTIASVNFYLKFVLRDALSVLSRLVLQVST
jgi:hypothetical protein